MKKTYFYGIASAAFVVGSMCLASCSSDQPIAEEGGSGSSTPGREVKTTLAITVEDGGDDDVTNVTNLTSKMGTRMSADATQNYIKENKTVATFHHFYNMAMMTYSKTPAASETWSKLIQLGSSTSKANSKDSNQRQLYIDIAVPTATSDVLFYAMGPQDGLTETSASFPISKENNGVLTSDYYLSSGAPTKPEGIKFNLQKRYAGTSAQLVAEASAKSIVDALNKLMNMQGLLTSKDSVNVTSSNDYTSLQADEGKDNLKDKQHALMVEKAYKSFKNMAESDESDATVKMLADLRDKMVQLTSGSAAAVKNTLQGLQFGLTKLGKPVDAESASTNSSFLYWKLYQEVTNILNNVLNANTFPADQNLPEGAVKLSYTKDAENGPFAYVTTENDNTSIITGSYTLDNSKVTYPASLAYFCNTPVMTNDKPISDMANQLPAAENWKKTDWSGFTDWQQKAVGENTQSIALRKAITYGVAQLKTTVKCNTENLKDSKYTETENKTIKVPEDGYTLTGVLVGGQPSQADWQFNPTSDATFDYTIYDSYMNTSDGKSVADTDGKPKGAGAIFAKYNTQSTPNYTLVLDNAKATTGESDKTIYIALEFVNNGTDFYGAQGGLISKGSKFYLVGKLDPAKGTKPTTTSDTGTTTTFDHVFVKGYTTTANFVIGEESLKKATNTIPDLRTAELSLGLMVDFTWKDGLTFDDVVLE